MEVAHLTFLAFTAFSSLRIVSYVPQIVRVAADQNGATAISYSTWLLWSGAHIATGVYAAINLSDLHLSVVSGIYAACCIIVILVTMAKRRCFIRNCSASTNPAGSPPFVASAPPR